MALYNGSAATEASSGSSYEPGLYRFKIVSASVNDWGSINYELQTKDEAGNEGPKVFDTLRITSTSDAMKQEVDRRLTTILGKVSIDSAEELVGKTGYVCLRKGHKYLEPMSFGGYFGDNKLSATGNKESIVKATQMAKDYDWKQDTYAVKKVQESQGHLASVDTDSGSEDPF